MGSDVAGTSTFWRTIFEYLDGEPIFADGLYRRGIRRLSDRTMWLVDETVRILSRLAATDAGTKATIAGSVDLATLAYDPVTGDLNGKTLILDGDVGASQTVTFGTGGTAPANPADVVTQILAQTSNKTAVLDSSSRLSVGSTTVGALSTIEVVGGTGAALLGLVVGTASGAGTVSDGASRVGWYEYSGIATGTVRTALKAVIDNAFPLAGLTASVVEASPIIDSTGASHAASATVADSTTASQALDLPDGASLTDVLVWINPTNAGVPGTRPVLSLVKLDITTGSPSVVDSVSDSEAAGTYPDHHDIRLTLGSPLTIDRSKYIYAVSLAGEAGAGKAPLVWFGTKKVYDLPAADWTR